MAQAEAMLYQFVAQAVQPIAHMEKNYNAQQIQKMMLEYLSRAAKKHAETRAPWQEKASDFAYKFFESFWKAFGESAWLDSVDFSWIIGTGLKVYLPPGDLANVSDDEFGEVVGKATALGFDCCRYYNWGSFVLKNVITGKTTQKKVRDSMDNAREELLKQNIQTAEEFVSAWIKATVQKLGNEAQYTLPHTTATRLFNAMIKSGGGIPLWLVQAAGGIADTVWEEVNTAVATVYNVPAGGAAISMPFGASMGGAAASMPFGASMTGSWGPAEGGKGSGKAFGYAPY